MPEVLDLLKLGLNTSAKNGGPRAGLRHWLKAGGIPSIGRLANEEHGISHGWNVIGGEPVVDVRVDAPESDRLYMPAEDALRHAAGVILAAIEAQDAADALAEEFPP